MGGGLAEGGPLRARVVAELARWSPALVVEGASRASVLAVIADGDLERAVPELHRRLFEGEEAA